MADPAIRTTLRPHQVQALAMLRASIGSGKRRPVLQAPTGAGKTVLAAAVVAGALSKGNRVVFCVPALMLIDQTVRMFWDEDIREVGVIQADHPLTDWAKPVQIASVQTLIKRELPKADVVVIDEAHKWFKFYGEWMAKPEWQRVPFIGLSATPWTKGLGKHFDDLIIAATTAELIEEGFLAPFRVFAPAHPDLTGVRTLAGDYHEGDLGAAMNKEALVADIVKTWKERADNRPTLCFAVDRAHAKHIQTLFIAAGVPCGYMDAFTPGAEREEIRKQFHRGELKIVANVGVLTTGIDWDIRCIVLCRPTKSEILFVQIIGRGLRTSDGKEDCLILDHSDTHQRLGFVTDIYHDKLDDGAGPAKKPPQKAKLPKECPQCAYLRPPKVRECPNCGFKPEVRSNVEHEDGELLELRAEKHSMADKQRWYSGFIAIADARGYKNGWAAHKYREKFKVWPRGLDETPIPAAPEIESYVRSRMVAWAKSKKRAAA